MIVIGVIGRPDMPLVHDAAACLVIDGKVVGALEQERVSRRRHAKGEGPESAVLALLDAFRVHPSEIDAVAYGWADAPENAPLLDAGLPRDVRVSDALTSIILPTIAGQLRSRKMFFFDHHLCHAAQAYYLNRFANADVLVTDGWGGDGSASLFHVEDGHFRLIERYDERWSLGIMYEAASEYAGFGRHGQGKLMGLSSYGRRSQRRFLTFDPADGSFRFDPRLSSSLINAQGWDGLSNKWLQAYEAGVFPFTATSSNIFDYATLAADVQATVEDLGVAMAQRLRRLSGADTLLLSGGVVLNALMNRRIALESGYPRVCGTTAPNDGGTVFGAALLAAALLGERPAPLTEVEEAPIFMGPPVSVGAIETALTRRGIGARAMERSELRALVAERLQHGQIVAWFDGPNEFGPRALGARSLLALPASRATLNKLNRIKGREAWRPAALSLTAAGFRELQAEPPVRGLSEYMLCMHAVGPDQLARGVAGIHVDHTSRAQYVPDATEFGALLGAVGAATGLPALVNTSLNIKGDAMVLSPDQAIDLMLQSPDVDLLVLAPYVVSRT